MRDGIAVHPDASETVTTQPLNDPAVAVLVQLIERIAVHDDAALRSLYELTSAKLLVFATRVLRRREFADEVVQEAFINIWRNASEYRSSVSPPMAWITVIVRNRTFDYLRQRKTLAGPETEWSEMLDDALSTDTPGPYELAVSTQKARQLSSCLRRLDAKQRRALELAYFCDLTHIEVANAMNAPLGTVKSWIRRGTEKLKISLEVFEETTPTLTLFEHGAGSAASGSAKSTNQKMKCLNTNEHNRRSKRPEV